MCFVSCDNNSSNDPQDYETLLLPHLWEFYKHNISNSDGVEIGHGYMKFSTPSTTALNGVSEMQFVNIGKVSGLNKITIVPADGWQNDEIETAENNGYLVRYHMRGTEGGWQYRRFYLKEYILLGGDDWYCKIQYDKKDWNPLRD